MLDDGAVDGIFVGWSAACGRGLRDNRAEDGILRRIHVKRGRN